MNERQTRTLKAMQGALGFFDKRRMTLAPELPGIHRRLTATVRAIHDSAGGQHQRGGKLLGKARDQLETARAKQALPLADLARPLFAGEPKIQEACRIPHKRAKTEHMLGAFARLTKTLQPHRRFLAQSNIDVTRIGRLREETRRLKKLFAAADSRTPEPVLATRRLAGLLKAARKDFKSINTLMLATCSELELVQWRTASRVGKRIGRPRKKRRDTGGDSSLRPE